MTLIAGRKTPNESTLVIARTFRLFVLTVGVVSLASALPIANASAADQIAYTCDSDICTVNPDTQSVTNLTNGQSGSATAPSWSPDDTRIAYRGECSAGFIDVCTVAVANPTSATNVSQLTTPGVSADYPSPSWSPDSTLLTYGINTSNLPYEDVEVSPSSGTSGPVSYGYSGTNGERYPVFAPDGNHIAFESLPGGIFTSPVTVNGSGATALPGGANSFMPSWSPDGTRIAMVHQVMPNVYSLRVVQANGSGTPLDLSVPADNGSVPTWSPDSAKLAWVTPAGNVHVSPADGSGAGIDLPRAAGAGFAGNPVWSPDGTRIAYNAYDANTHTQIYVVPADGSAPAVAVTSAGYNNVEPSWKPAPYVPPGTPPYTPPGTPPGAPPTSPQPTPTRPAKIIGFRSGGPINPFHLNYGVNCNADGSLHSNPVCDVKGDGFTKGQTVPHRFLAKPKGAKKVLVITGRIKVPAGKTKQLKFKVTKAGAKLLKRGKTLNVTVTIRVTQAGTKTVSETRKLKLKAPHKH